MKIEELLCEMAMKRKKAGQIILNLSMPINEHLLKLMAFDEPNNVLHWRVELNDWISKVSSIRLKSHNPLGSYEFYFDCLYAASIHQRLFLE